MKKVLFFCLSLMGLFLFTSKAQTVVKSYDFEDAAQDTDWHYVNGSNGWFINTAADVNHTAGGSRALYISLDSGTTNTYDVVVSDSWAYVDVIIPAGYAEFTLEFDWKCKGESTYDFMRVYVGPPSTPSGSMRPEGAVSLINELRPENQTYFNGYDGFGFNLYPGWNHYFYAFPGALYDGDTVRLYLYWHNDISVANNPPMAIDDIILTGLNCGSISNMTAIPGPSDLTIMFSPALSTDSQWDYICVLKDSSMTDEPPISVSDTSFIISNLLDYTEYDVYVRTNCGTEQSFWKKQTFRTTCYPITTLPYYENFDSTVTTGVDVYPDCWFRLNTYSDYTSDNYPYLDNSGYGGGGALKFLATSGYYNVAIMPAIDATIPINTLMVTFMYNDYDATHYIIVGIMDNPMDINTFVAVDTVYNPIPNVWSEFDVSLDTYSGTGRYVAFKNEQGNLYIDNVKVDAIPGCIRPENVTVTNITTTGVTVSWTPRGDESSWEVVVVPYGGDPESVTPETTLTDSLAITGLNGDVSYQVYVRSNCAADGYSAWTFPVTFRTDCSDFMTIPYYENFDTYVGFNPYPSCWSRLYSEDEYPYISNLYYSSAPSSLDFYTMISMWWWPGNEYAYAITPAVDTVSHPIHSLSISFKIYKTMGTYGHCQIGVMNHPDSMSTFTMVAEISAEDFPINTWKEFDFSLSSYTGSGQYIALLAPSGENNEFHIDDVVIYETPSCLKPVNVHISQITSESVTVDWTPRNDETAWAVAVVPTGTDPETATPVDAYTHPYTVQNLTDNTTYDVYVKSDCGDGDESIWSAVVTFTTFCSPQTVVLPFIENFDNCNIGTDASLPSCWMRYTNASSTMPFVDNAYASSGTNSVYYYCYTGEYAYLVSPAFDLSQHAAGTLHLTCKTLQNFSSYGRLNIGYMTDPADLSTFTLLKSIYPSDYDEVETWYLSDMLLHESFTSPVYFAFMSPAGSYNYCYLDDVVLDYVPECSEPSNLRISNICGTSALVSWTESMYGATGYTVEYAEVGEDTNWISVAGVNGNSVLLSGLTPTTPYLVRVSAICGSGNSDYLTESFITGCLAGGEITIDDGTIMYSYLPLYHLYNYSYSQQLYLSSELNGASVYRGIAFYLTSTSSPTRNISVYLGNTTQSSLEVSTAIPSSHQDLVYTGPINLQEGWNDIMFDTIFQYTGGNLVVTVDDNTGSYSGSPDWLVHNGPTLSLYDYADNINYDPANPSSINLRTIGYRNNIKIYADCDSTVTCIAPNVFITALDDQSATLEWAAGNEETSWEMEYQLTSDSVWTSLGTVTSSPHVLDGLTSNTQYKIRMRSICTPDYSNWVTLSFTTECAPIVSLPYVENFNAAAGAGENFFIDCWIRGTDGMTPYPYPDDQITLSGSPYSLYFNAEYGRYTYAATPRFDESIQMDSLQISFHMFQTTLSNYIEVGIMSDPNDYTTFVPIGIATPFVANTWELAEFNTRHYGGSGYYVAFRIPQGDYIELYIEDVTVRYIPGCPRITGLAVSNIAAHAATVTWTAGGDEDTWEYLYGETGTVDLDNDLPVQIMTTSISLTGLTANSHYDVYVRGICQNGEHSPWSYVSFRTFCEDVTVLPFMENFDSYPATVKYPYCWFRLNTYQDYMGGADFPYIDLEPTSGSDALFFISTQSAYNIAITPAFAPTIPVNTLQASFQYNCFYFGDEVYMIVGVMTDPTDAGTFVPVDTVTNTDVLVWSLKRVSLANYTGTGRYIAFKNITSGFYSYAYIDNVVIDIIPTCDEPQDLTITNLTDTSADLSWQNATGESTCQILAVPEGVTPDYTQAATVSVSPYTMHGLTPNTVYKAYIRTVCADGSGHSNWVDIAFMTISSSPAQTPYFHAFENSEENARWVLNNGNAANKWYIGKPAAAPDSVLFISTDNGAHNLYNGYSPSVSWAYRDIQFGEGGEFDVSFKWKAQGESGYDYLRFFLGPPMPVTAGGSYILIPPTGMAVTSDELYGDTAWTTLHFLLNGSYANTTQRLYFSWVNDDMSVYNPPASIDSIQILVNDCGTPYNLVVSNITTTSATVTFAPGATTDMAWQYVIGSPGFNPVAATPVDITTSTFQVPNLTSATNYELYVRTSCVSGSYSSWSEPVRFTTSCDIITTFPYIQDFENNGIMPLCWTQQQISSEFQDWRFGSGSAYGSVTTAHGGSYNAYYYHASYNSAVAMLISPIFDLTQVNAPYVSFWHTQEAWGNDQDTLKVYYRTDAADAWTQLADYTTDISTWTFDSLALPNPSATYQLAFEGTTAYGKGIALDDITIDGTTGGEITCDAPTGLSASVTTTTATLSWTETGDFEVSYKESTATGWSANTSVTGNSTTITDLTPNTGYDWRVRQVCENTVYSDWATGTFQTIEEPVCPMPTNLTVSNVTDHSATLNWEQEGDVSAWTLNYRRAEEGSTWTTSTIYTHPYTIVELMENTDYQAQVRANCADGTYSEYTDIVNFTTSVSGIEDYTLSNCLSLYPNPTSSYIDVKFNDNIQVSELKVYDVYGKLLSTIQVNENPTRIDVSALAGGVYFVRAFTDKGIANKSFIKK